MVLKKLKKYAKKLCFAEYNLSVKTPRQKLHYLSALIQAQMYALCPNKDANIRTVLTRQELIDLLKKAGWHVQKQQNVSTKNLDDAKWEVAFTIDTVSKRLKALKIDDSFKAQLQAQITLLANLATTTIPQTLDSFSLIAEQ